MSSLDTSELNSKQETANNSEHQVIVRKHKNSWPVMPTTIECDKLNMLKVNTFEVNCNMFKGWKGKTLHLIYIKVN